MQKVLTAEQMREVDRLTTERYGIPSILLMENAAHAVARVITEKLGGSVKGKSVLILCGKGNNGGDGAALARILWTQGAWVAIEMFGNVGETKGDGRINFQIMTQLPDRTLGHFEDGVQIGEFTDNMVENWLDTSGSTIAEWDVLVDAVFGTGITRPLSDTYIALSSIRSLRDYRGKGKPYLVSIDIPSGLYADTAELPDRSFNADITVTFTAPKPANVLLPAASHCGELVVANIGSPKPLLDEQLSQLLLSDSDDAWKWLESTKFSDSSYKNKRGHALIVAGSEDYSGAAVMCGNSAMRSGVGLTTLLVPASCKVEVASRVIPEVIVRTLDGVIQKPAREQGRFNQAGKKGDDARSEFALADAQASASSAETIRQADSILVGPGLRAKDKGIGKLVREIVEKRTVPVVVDAGALGFFNPPAGVLQKPARKQGRIAEAGAELDCTSSKIATTAEASETFNSRIALADARAFAPDLPPLIVSPHEGEFMRLLGTEDKSVIEDRVAAVRKFAVANNVILVLKGERVLIGSPDGRVVVNPTGNSGLGKAGNGDTLAGILAGFVAQAVKFEIDIFETVVAAVYVAGMAGDVAEKKYGKRVMTASDVRECLADVFAEFESPSA